jgi:hypothetical protein
MHEGYRAPPSKKIVTWVEALKNGRKVPYDTKDYDLNGALQFFNEEKPNILRAKLRSSVAPIAVKNNIFEGFETPLLPRSTPIPIPNGRSYYSSREIHL